MRHGSRARDAGRTADTTQIFGPDDAHQALLRHADQTPTGQVGHRRAHRAIDLIDRDPERLQALRIRLQPQFTTDAAVTSHAGDAGNRQQLTADGVIDKPTHFVVTASGSGDGIGQDRQAHDVDAFDHRVAHPGRQFGADPRHGIPHFIGRAIDRGFQRELNHRHTAAGGHG